jgi:molecular chaperone DnaK (HSP70)
VDPEVAVALGAALYGAMLDGETKDGVDVVDGMYTW